MLVIHAEVKCTFKAKSDDFTTLEIYFIFCTIFSQHTLLYFTHPNTEQSELFFFF